MSGNSIGVLFRVTTWGESHGKALGAVVDGCPPNIDLTDADIQEELNRRRPGQDSSTSSRQEEDLVEILHGILSSQELECWAVQIQSQQIRRRFVNWNKRISYWIWTKRKLCEHGAGWNLFPADDSQ